MIKWRGPGEERLSTIDVRRFERDQIVVHFGGRLTSVDAYTFANSLVSFADTVRAVNALVNPSQEIDVRLEAVGPGSFRALIKQTKRGLGGLFKSAPANVFWIIAALFIEQSLEGESSITVNGDEVVISRGKERIIVSKEVFEQVETAKRDDAVRRGMRRTFENIEQDNAIENFGLTPDLTDSEPLVQIPREDFGNAIRVPDAEIPSENRRQRHERAALVVLKPWVNATKKKWAFEWNGVPIFAFVRDEIFLLKVKNHEIRFGNGDVVEVEIEFFQNLDPERGVWLTDTSTYRVVRVFVFEPVGETRVVFK